MKYNTKNQLEANKVTHRLSVLIKKGAKVELKEITAKTISQNNYVHLIMQYAGVQLGYSEKEIKEYLVKRIICKDVFLTETVSQITGEVYQEYRSFSELNKEEHSLVINKFINYCALNFSLRLPDPSDLVYADCIFEMQQEIERNKEFM